jgi:Toprim-like
MRTSREEIDQLKRDANLVDYACRKRGYYVDTAESSPRGNPTNWILRRDADDAKILLLRGPKCWLYYDLRLRGGELDKKEHQAGTGQASTVQPSARTAKALEGYGSIIDFVQEELGLSKGAGTPSFGIVLREIRDFVGAPPLQPSHRLAAPAYKDPAYKERKPTSSVLEAWTAARETSTSQYLESRSLTPATLRHPRFAGTWRTDQRGNVLFPHRADDGLLATFEVKNYNYTSSAVGGVKTGFWRSNDFPHDKFLFLTESAINALSFHQLHPHQPTRFRSFGGRIGAEQLRLAEKELTRLPSNITVLLAFDGNGDLAGREYEAQVRRIMPPHVRAEVCYPPSGKDWNDHLQALDIER